MYLLDTNVISDGAPGRVGSSKNLTDWMDHNSARLFLSVVTVAEIEDGIAKLARIGATKKAVMLTRWLHSVLRIYSSRILAFDLQTARIAGGMSDLARGNGHATGFPDIAIAATAKQHGYIVLTRNMRHFAVLDVPTHDPFAALPQA